MDCGAQGLVVFDPVDQPFAVSAQAHDLQVPLGFSGCRKFNDKRFVEKVDRLVEGNRHIPQASRRETALTGLVFLDLLECDPQQGGKRFLGQAEFPPGLSHFLVLDVAIELVCKHRTDNYLDV